jgi:hypothetical protein
MDNIGSVVQHWPLQAVVAIIAGVVVLLAPRILNYVIAAYLLIFGAVGLLHFVYREAIRPQAIFA